MKRTVPYSDIIFKAFTLLVFSTLVFLPFAPVLAEAFVVEDSDVLVTPDTWRVIDPEFDNVYFRALWQDSAERLWISKLDQETGKFSAAANSTYQLDTGLAPVNADNGNGPEWVYGQGYQRPAIIYTVDDATYGYRLKVARQDPVTGAWTKELLYDDGEERFCPLGTYSQNSGPPRILYQKRTEGGIKEYWRTLDDPSSEVLLNEGRGQAHFSFDGTQIALTQVPDLTDPNVFECLIESTVKNPMIYDIATYSKTCARQTTVSAGFPWILDPAAFGNKETLLFTLENELRRIVVEQKEGTGWVRLKTISTTREDPEPYLSSPEPFKGSDGKWYVVYAATSVAASSFYTDPTATGSIWIASLSDDSLHEKVTPATPAKRSEPEALTLPNGKTAIYYTYSLYDDSDPLNPHYSEQGTLKMTRIILP